MLSILITVGFLCTATAIAEVMEVSQPAMVLANRQGVASLVCKYKHIGNAKEIRVTLLKQTGDQFTEICASTYTTEFKMFSVEEVIQCRVSPSRNNVTLTLTGLQVNDTGLYVCKMERMYPPPYFMNKGNGTQLYVIDTEKTTSHYWSLCENAF
uniref:Cytotoxic T-lymphocyte protein 4 n=2 Tax=Anatinae TaxID=2068716 RepID=D0V089_ANAPL|nr:cytotoxic T lymphocyte-associated antigen-4 [Anas platyrhynchos]